jgi:hypothetical protein
VHDVATVSRDLEANGWVADVVVSRTGTATMAWMAWSGFANDPVLIRTSDAPPAPGDPQDPPDPPDAQDPLDARVSARGGDLGIDAADRLTMLWRQDLLTPAPGHVFTEYYDLVPSDRAPGGRWSGAPPVLGRTGFIGDAQLEVNASGAAVVAWQQHIGRGSDVFASYRATAGGGWTPRERVSDAQWFRQAGIDDEGRVLLVYNPRSGGRGGVKVIRRTPADGWGRPQSVGGPDTNDPRLAVGAGGAAVVIYTRYEEEGWPNAPQLTSRMSPAGNWGAPVRQPYGLPVPGPAAIDMDAKGRTLFAWWDRADLMVRWSRSDGRWREPCVLAADVSHPRQFGEVATQVVVNRHGDALVTWRAKGRVQQLWARYQRAGQAWTQPVRVTPVGRPPRGEFSTDVGDRGHVAIAWTTRGQLHVRRASPTP